MRDRKKEDSLSPEPSKPKSRSKSKTKNPKKPSSTSRPRRTSSNFSYNQRKELASILFEFKNKEKSWKNRFDFFLQENPDVSSCISTVDVLQGKNDSFTRYISNEDFAVLLVSFHPQLFDQASKLNDFIEMYQLNPDLFVEQRHSIEKKRNAISSTTRSRKKNSLKEKNISHQSDADHSHFTGDEELRKKTTSKVRRKKTPKNNIPGDAESHSEPIVFGTEKKSLRSQASGKPPSSQVLSPLSKSIKSSGDNKEQKIEKGEIKSNSLEKSFNFEEKMSILNTDGGLRLSSPKLLKLAGQRHIVVDQLNENKILKEGSNHSRKASSIIEEIKVDSSSEPQALFDLSEKKKTLQTEPSRPQTSMKDISSASHHALFEQSNLTPLRPYGTLGLNSQATEILVAHSAHPRLKTHVPPSLLDHPTRAAVKVNTSSENLLAREKQWLENSAEEDFQTTVCANVFSQPPLGALSVPNNLLRPPKVQVQHPVPIDNLHVKEESP